MTTRQHPLFPIPVAETVLPNGLTVITAETPSQFVCVSMVFAVGSLDDGAHPGIAHFLEHLLYEGAARDGVHPKLRHLHGKGIRPNAETGSISTEYWIDGYSCDLVAILEALFSIVSTFECSAFHVDRERPVILQEIDDHDDPDERFLLWQRRTFFPHAPTLHYTAGGTRESVTGITVEALGDFFKRFYDPTNTALIVTGGVSHAAVLSACNVLYQQYAAQAPRPRRAIIQPRFSRAIYETETHPSSLTLLFEAARNEEDNLLLGLVYDLLVHSPFGVLYRRVRKDERFVYAVSSGESSWPKPYDYVEIGASPDRFAYLEETIFESIERFIAGDWDGDLWGSVLANRQRFFDERREAPREQWHDWMRDMWLEGQDPDFDAEGVLAAVTRERLFAIARQYLSRERYGCLSVIRV